MGVDRLNRDYIQTVKLMNPNGSLQDRIAEVFEDPDAYRMYFLLDDHGSTIKIKERKRFNNIEWKFYFEKK